MNDDISSQKRYSLVKQTADYRIVRMGSLTAGENVHYGPVNSYERCDAVRYDASWRISLTLYTPLSATEASREDFVFFVLHVADRHTAWTTLLNEVLRSLPARNTGAMVSAVRLERLTDDAPIRSLLHMLF